MIIKERQSTHVYRQKQLFTKEELESRESLCIHEQPAYCNAACPLKLDTKAMVAAMAAGDFSKALQLYEKITPFPYILSSLHCQTATYFFTSHLVILLPTSALSILSFTLFNPIQT